MHRWADRATVAALAGAILLLAALAGTDDSFDLRNYHLYDGYALLHGRLGFDLAPAQLQTFYAPTLDALYFLLFRTLNDTPRALNAILAIPNALAVCLAWAIARLYLPRGPALLATIIGGTGAALLSTLATTQSEAPVAAIELAALLLLLRNPTRGILPGLLAGLAVGLKLTAAPYALALMAASGPKRLLRTGSGVALGAALAGGYWWFVLWHRYADPVFPYFNDLFRSPWGQPDRLADRRFLPHGILHALAYPFFWAIHPVTLVSELPLRDPRIALALAASLWLVVHSSSRGPRSGTRRPRPTAPLLPAMAGPDPAICASHRPTNYYLSLVAFFLLTLALWETQFSIFRYLAGLELLSGTLIVLAFPRLSPAIAVATLALTVYPDWGRTVGPQAIAVHFPPIPPNALVLLLDPGPTSYVIPFAPPGIRFAGVNSNLVHPGQPIRLTARTGATLRAWSGPLWSLEIPTITPGMADIALDAYHLIRGDGCRYIPSNLDDSNILACPLIRVP